VLLVNSGSGGRSRQVTRGEDGMRHKRPHATAVRLPRTLLAPVATAVLRVSGVGAFANGHALKFAR